MTITNLLDFPPDELESFVTGQGLPRFRSKQLYRQMYQRLEDEIGNMSDLPKALREKLGAACEIGNLTESKVQIGDGGLTRKAVFKLPDGKPVETVLMIYPGRATVCVSVQSGCAMGCTFCATGQLGYLRNLTSGQIIEQVLWAARTLRRIADNPDQEVKVSKHLKDLAELPDHLTNVVYMGMGEAFCNYNHWWGSVERLHDPDGFNLGARSFTVSTVGLLPGIKKLAAAPLPINLAVSLHAARDDLRESMMPVNKGFPIQKLMETVRDYLDQTGRRVSFEYILLEHTNDTPEDARQLATLLKQGPLKNHGNLVHVNLIPWNPIPGTPLKRSHRQRVLDFQTVLQQAKVPCTVRVERGVDIDAACGQLAGTD